MTRRNAGGKKKNTGTLWWVAGIAVALVGGLVVVSQLGGKKAVTPLSIQSDAELHAVRNVIGSLTARVQLVEYGDYL